MPVVHEPVLENSVDDNTTKEVDGKAVNDPTDIREQDPENTSKENFQDAVENPMASSQTTADDVHIP